MSLLALFVSLIVAFSYRVSAHGIVTKIIVGGTSTYQGYDPNFQYMPTPPPTIGWASPPTQDRGPVDGTKLQDPNVICQRNATPAKIAATVNAGEVVSLQWTVWPNSHKGPMLDYLAACPGDCSTVDKTTLKFFKIDGVGMLSTNGTPPTFADDQMIANNNTWSVQIPSSIASGNYVLRHETIALHQAQGAGGAQLYPQCVNIQVTGGGSDTPDGVLGTQLYKETDPGIQFNIYQKFSDVNAYTVPGPALYSGATQGTAMASAPGGGSAATATGAPKASSSGSASSATATATTAGSANAGAKKAEAKSEEINNVLDNAQGMISDPCSAYLNAMKRGEKIHARDFRAQCVGQID